MNPASVAYNCYFYKYCNYFFYIYHLRFCNVTTDATVAECSVTVAATKMMTLYQSYILPHNQCHCSYSTASVTIRIITTSAFDYYIFFCSWLDNSIYVYYFDHYTIRPTSSLLLVVSNM